MGLIEKKESRSVTLTIRTTDTNQEWLKEKAVEYNKPVSEVVHDFIEMIMKHEAENDDDIPWGEV